MHLHINSYCNDNDNNGNNKDEMFYTHIFERKKRTISILFNTNENKTVRHKCSTIHNDNNNDNKN